MHTRHCRCHCDCALDGFADSRAVSWGCGRDPIRHPRGLSGSSPFTAASRVIAARPDITASTVVAAAIALVKSASFLLSQHVRLDRRPGRRSVISADIVGTTSRYRRRRIVHRHGCHTYRHGSQPCRPVCPTQCCDFCRPINSRSDGSSSTPKRSITQDPAKRSSDSNPRFLIHTNDPRSRYLRIRPLRTGLCYASDAGPQSSRTIKASGESESDGSLRLAGDTVPG